MLEMGDLVISHFGLLISSFEGRGEELLPYIECMLYRAGEQQVVPQEGNAALYPTMYCEDLRELKFLEERTVISASCSLLVLCITLPPVLYQMVQCHQEQHFKSSIHNGGGGDHYKSSRSS